MATDIGPKIGIDGEAEFRKQLTNINQQLKTLGTEMKAVTSAFDVNDNSQEALAAQAGVLTRQIETQEQKLSQLQKGLDASAQKYGENDTLTLKWAATVNNATADLNKMRAQLTKIESEMDGTADASDNLADGMENAGDAADSARSKFSAATVAIGNLAANAISAAVSAVGDLVSSLWNLDETTEEYRIAQGRLNTAFEAAGYGAEAAQRAYSDFYGILGDTDRATEASQLLAKLADNEKDLSKWTNIAAGVNGTFGDSLPIESLIEAANETARTGTVVGTLADALNWAGTVGEDEFNAMLESCSSEGERNQLIMETLSQTYDEAANAFYKNSEALVASREAQLKMDNVLAQLGQTVSVVKGRLMSELIPSLASVASAFNGVISGAQGADQQLSAAIGSLVTTAVSKLPEFLRFGVQIVSSLLSGIVQSLPTLVSAVPRIISELGTALSELFPQVLKMGVQILDQLTTGIETGLPNMIERLPQVIEEFLQFVTDNLPSILEKGVEILMSLISGIINAIPKLIAALPKIIVSITKFIANNLPEIVDAGINIILSLITGIVSAIPDLVAALPQLISAIVDGIGNLMGGIIDIGANIVNGIKKGIQNAWNTFVNWIGDLFENSLVGKVLNVLGIHSPSKVFADMGKNMVLGLGEGWNEEFSRVKKDIESGLKFDAADMGLNFDDIQNISYNIQQATPRPEDTFGNLAAGMVNGINTAMTGAAAPQSATIILEVNGRELARALVPDIRAVERSSPVVLSGV